MDRLAIENIFVYTTLKSQFVQAKIYVFWASSTLIDFGDPQQRS